MNEAQNEAHVAKVVASSPDQKEVDGSLANCDKSKSSSSSYKYSVLNNLKAGTSVNVYGVVKYFRPVSKSRGSGT